VGSYDDAWIIVPPFDFQQSLRTRIKSGIGWDNTRVFGVLVGLALVLVIVDAILHLPFLLVALAWDLRVGKPRFNKRPAPAEVPGEPSLESLARWYGISCRRYSTFRADMRIRSRVISI
jgi:hypothetical protein